ncbi:MAG: M28 family peptidase [Acidobacteria bacterium]|nr:M28 family peptidase [Acidobacteriota bacterium]
MVFVFLVAVLLLRSSAQTGSGIDSAKAWDHLRTLVNIGPRVSGTPGNAQARQYILETLGTMGITASEQAFGAETPRGRVKMANLIATLPGSRPERIALGTHFDTKQFREFRFVGANDGGSSTALVLELARVLQARRRLFTIDLLFFDGEEALVEWGPSDGTYGSRHYVGAARTAGILSSLKALVLLDMVGDRQLAFRRESNSTPWLTDLVWAAARRLGHQQHFLADSTPIEDDHLPFLRAGVPSVDIIDLDYAPWHTANDTIEQVSARSLQVTGEVVLAALQDIEARLAKN